MSEFEIPESLQHYFNDKRVRAAVDALLVDAAGEKMPESTWSEARDYNDALLMALQTRRDFVDLHFRIWEASFGKAGAWRLGEEYFDWDYNPSCVWYNQYISCTIYPKRGGYGSRPSEEFYVTLSDEMLVLSIYRWEDDYIRLSPSVLADVEGWQIRSDAEYQWVENESVPLVAFFDNPDPIIQRFREEAGRAVVALLEGSP